MFIAGAALQVICKAAGIGLILQLRTVAWNFGTKLADIRTLR
jgi:hypothetical protein